MPFYEYECQSCQHCLEVLQKISDPVLTTCPECGRESLRKLISAPVFRLKGKGWYETDFKSDAESKRNLAGSEKEEVKKEEVKTEAPAEAKPESKEAKPAAAAPAAPATPASPPAPPKRKKAATAAARTSARRPASKAAPAAKEKAKRKAVAKSTR
jgi:putative FmdB family regulatory protein